jgi:transcriptional regulator with XRE-family HTH domain
MVKAKAVSEDKLYTNVIASRVEERVNAHNLSRNEASRRAGLGLSYVADILSGKLKNPSRHALAKLGQVLDTDVAYFVGEQDTPRRKGGSAQKGAASGEQSIPLYRVGLPDADGFFSLDESRRTSITSPFEADGLYFIAVPDDTMAPRYLSGESVIVDPNRQASKGGFAVVRHADGRVAIRQIVAVAPDKITVRSLSPDEVVELKRDTVASLDCIAGSYVG